MRKTITWIVLLVLLTQSATALSMSNFWANLFGEPIAPEIIEQYASLEDGKFRVGVIVQDKYGIRNASALAQLTHGDTFVELVLVGSSDGQYVYEAVLNTSEWTETSFIITNLKDKTAYSYLG